MGISMVKRYKLKMKRQCDLFLRPIKERWEKEWISMPEYNNKEIKPYTTLKIHFKTEKDYLDFKKLIKKSLTIKTKSIWYPAYIKNEASLKRYIDES